MTDIDFLMRKVALARRAVSIAVDRAHVAGDAAAQANDAYRAAECELADLIELKVEQAGSDLPPNA